MNWLSNLHPFTQGSIVFSIFFLLCFIIYIIYKLRVLTLKIGEHTYQIGVGKENRSIAGNQSKKNHYRSSHIKLPDDIKIIFTRATSPETLHYLGMFRQGRKIFSKDIFHRDQISKFFTSQSPDEKRDAVEVLAFELHQLIHQINLKLSEIDQGSMFHAVFDVDLGAVYYYQLGVKNKYLIGLTLDESHVNDCDDVMENAVQEIRECYKPISGIDTPSS